MSIFGTAVQCPEQTFLGIGVVLDKILDDWKVTMFDTFTQYTIVLVCARTILHQVSYNGQMSMLDADVQCLVIVVVNVNTVFYRGLYDGHRSVAGAHAHSRRFHVVF